MLIFGTADDVFAMAVRIEENGQAFYSGAAAKANDKRTKDLFASLADMEAGHVAVFRKLRSELPGSFPTDAVWDPEGLAQSYLQAAADTHIFTKESAEARLKQVNSPIDVFDIALQFEKDSVAFFIGMKEILPDAGGRSEIDSLIRAEMEHIQMLSSARKQFESTGTAPIS
jgi:rubrerythrin